MTWTPNPQLVIGFDVRSWAMLEPTWATIGARWANVVAPDPSVLYTDVALESIRISRGRSELFSEPRPGFLTAELVDRDGDGFDIEPYQDVRLTIEDTAGDPLLIFSGRVSDTSATLLDTGQESGTPSSVHTVIAVGPLAQLNTEFVATAGLAQQDDGERITALVAAGGFPTEAIDPGLFDISALPAKDGGYNALLESYKAAFSARGVIWDDPRGAIAYANADRRQDADQADDYTELPASILSARALTVTSTSSDVTNDVSVVFEGGVERQELQSSIDVYGRVARQFQTSLANPGSASGWATNYLNGRSFPTLKLEQVSARLDLVDDDTLRDKLIALDVNDGILLADIPITLGLEFRRTFIEGIDWTVDRERIGIALTLSDASLSIGFVIWQNVDATLAWEDVDATLTWADAETVGV